MKMPLLVQPHELEAALDDPSLVVVDVSVNRTPTGEGAAYTLAAGRAAYDASHIPGALFADLVDDFSAPETQFMFTVPDAARMERVATSLGIGEGAHVVAYTQEMPYFATRFWWLLRYFGFDDVSVLDGGLDAWRDAGLPTSNERSAASTVRRFVAHPRPQLLARIDEVERAASGEASQTCLVHALSTNQFRGTDLPEDPRTGRIPGSVNVPWSSVIDENTGRYRDPEALDKLFRTAGLSRDQDVITYCGGGIAATMDAFALALTGRNDARVYDGSLDEWSVRSSRPLIRD